MRKLKFLCLSAFFLLVQPGFSQEFTREYSLGTISKSGLYKVQLSPEFRSFAQKDSFIELPYFIRVEEKDTSHWDSRILPINILPSDKQSDSPRIQIISKEILKDQITRIQIWSDQKYEFNPVQIKVQSPIYYSRELQFYTKQIVKPRRGRAYTQNNLIMVSQLEKGKGHSFDFNLVLNDTLAIDILNLNNPPLRIEQLVLRQSPWCFIPI
ncbi:MAG: hypothetical protein SGJ00_04280 [bacterium]|nr:hypothetical protein [bacterium]